MKGLILKDLCTINTYKKSFVVMLFIFLAISFTNASFSNFLIYWLPFFCIMLCISTFNYDEASKWNPYALTFPINKKDIVKSKYVLSLLILCVGAMLGVAIAFLFNAIKPDYFTTKTILGTTIGSVIGMLFIIIVMYPLIYKYGAEKGRLMLFVFVFGVALLGTGIVTLLKSMNIDFTGLIDVLNQIENYVPFIIALVLIGILYISYRISVKIFLKKEF